MQFLWTFCCLLSYLLFKAQIKLTPFAHSKKKKMKVEHFCRGNLFQICRCWIFKICCLHWKLFLQLWVPVWYFFEFWFLFWFYLCHFLCFYSSSFCSIPPLPCLCFFVSSLVFLIYTSCFYCGKNVSLCLVYFNLLLLFLFYDFFLLSISLCVYTVLSFSFVGLEF